MKTQYYTATSINGFLADEHNSLEWLFQFGPIESMKDQYPRFLERVGALAMGATTFEWLMGRMQLVDHPERWPYTIPTWVFSHRKQPVIAGADIRFVQGDVAPVHAEMASAAGDRNIWLVGGGDLVGQFHDRGLLDEVILSVAPVMLGGGAPLLPRGITTPPLRLVDVERHGEVFVVLTYAVQGNTQPPGGQA